jgi:hypothetical protein
MFQKHGMSGARRKSAAERPKYRTCCQTLFRKKKMRTLSNTGFPQESGNAGNGKNFLKKDSVHQGNPYPRVSQ